MSTDKKYRFETLRSTADRSPIRRRTRGPCRSTRRPRTSSRRRPRGQAVCAAGVRQHLHPHHEPDDRRLRKAHGRARRRRRRAGRRPRAGGRSTPSLNIAGAGDEIVSASTLYGGTYNLFDVTRCRSSASRSHFVEPTIPRTSAEAITPKTKAHLCRDDRQPARQRARHRRRRRRSPTSTASR